MKYYVIYKFTKLLKPQQKNNPKRDLPAEVNDQEVTALLLDHFFIKTDFCKLKLI